MAGVIEPAAAPNVTLMASALATSLEPMTIADAPVNTPGLRDRPSGHGRRPAASLGQYARHHAV